MARVQVFQFSVTFGASTTATYTIGSGSEDALTDVTNAFMTFGVEGNVNDAASGQISGEITDVNTLTFTRVGTNGTPVIKGYVVEDDDLLVDHITLSSFSGATENTSALSQVDTLAKAWTLASGRDTATATSAQSTFVPRLFDSSGLKVGVESGTSGANTVDAVAIQAVQYPSCSVQRGALTDMGSGTSQTQAVSAVDLSKSFCQAWYKADDSSSIEPGDIGLQVKFNSTTQIGIDRGNGSDCDLIDGQYEAVSFTNSIAVQAVNETLAAAAASGTNSLTALSDSGANALVIGGCGMFGFTGKTTFDSSDLFGEMQASATVTSGTNVTVARGATTGQLDISFFVLDWAPSTAPVATVPASGTCINTYGEIAVPGVSVTEGSASLVAVATTCTAGCTLTYNTTGTSVTVSGNGTNAATLLNGADETEYNMVLDTLTMRGTTVDTTITVTVIPTDGTLNDSKQFTVFCDPFSLTATGTNANVIAWVEDLRVRILQDQTNDTVSVHVEDDTGTPLEVDSSFVVGLATYFNPLDGTGIGAGGGGGGSAAKLDTYVQIG